MVWNHYEIILLLRDEIERVSLKFHEEMHRSGIDSLNEIQLHPLICNAFTDSVYGVIREVEYPTFTTLPSSNRDRKRCDIVLTPQKKQILIDPVEEQRIHNQASKTLFASVVHTHQHADHEIQPNKAYWLEIKCVGQVHYVDGIPVENTSYSRDLIHGTQNDIIKLASDPEIQFGAVLLVHFGSSPEIGEHDLMKTASLLIDQHLPLAAPLIDGFAIPDYAGNTWCTLGLFAVKF